MGDPDVIALWQADNLSRCRCATTGRRARRPGIDTHLLPRGPCTVSNPAARAGGFRSGRKPRLGHWEIKTEMRILPQFGPLQRAGETDRTQLPRNIGEGTEAKSFLARGPLRGQWGIPVPAAGLLPMSGIRPGKIRDGEPDDK